MNSFNGNMAEVTFLKQTMEKGYTISKPVVGEYKYDFIVDSHKLYRVQVKSTNNFSERNSRYKVNVAYGGDTKRVYTADQIDIFAIYVRERDEWYLMPVNDVNTKTLNLYPHRESNGTFEKYKNKWDIFSR